MNANTFADWAEIQRLTQSGQLQQATDLIQRRLRGEATPAAAADQSGSLTIEGSCRVVEDETKAFAGSGADSAEPEKMERRSKNGKPFIDLSSLSAAFRMPDQVVKPGRQVSYPGQFLEGSYTDPHGSRQYKLYVPSGYRGEALPLVVMLHGCKQDPDDFAIGTGMNALAETERCLVLYPAQAASANGSNCWNWFRRGDQRRDQGEPALLAGMTRDVVARYGLDGKRVYVAGLSAGGAMAAVLGATYPDLYAAVGVHSGLPYAAAQDLPSALKLMQSGEAMTSVRADRPVPLIVFHGDRDTTVHPRNGEQLLRQAGAEPVGDVEQGRKPKGHSYTRKIYRNAEYWVVHGAGHAWSGGDAAGSYTDAAGPDASREMWRFFSTHRQR